MKSVKRVEYCMATKQPIITIRVKGYNRMLNPPKAVVKKEKIQPLILGY